MTTDTEPLFVDTNILIYASLDQAPQYSTARARLGQIVTARREAWISRQIIREYLAGMTRPGILTGRIPLPDLPEDARRFEAFFRVAEDDANVARQFVQLLRRFPVAGGEIHDANIVATMLVHGIRRLLTANGDDFARYSTLITIEPLT